jgi:hypothetical protein
LPNCYERCLTATSRAAVVIPFHKLSLTADERLSLDRLREVLGRHELQLVLPDDLDGTIDGLPALRFDGRLFRDHRAHQRLMLSRALYRALSCYEYVLVHHLDSLVFADELEAWCDRGFDYVGAPWTRRGSAGVRFAGAGNGGFSLRRVDSCLKALEFARAPTVRLAAGGARVARAARLVRRRHPTRPGAIVHAVHESYLYEDKFFALDAPRLDPSFHVAPAEVAVSFAFETEPRWCYAQNGRSLPFGCHRWARYDRAFWEAHL